MERTFTEIFPDVPFMVDPEIRDSSGLSLVKLPLRGLPVFVGGSKTFKIAFYKQFQAIEHH